MKRIKIKNYEWKVIESESCPDLYNSEEERLINYGITDYLTQTIFIWKDLTPERKRSTIIHELTHAFLDMYMGKHQDNYTEEEMCDIFATYGDDIISLTNLLTNGK